MNRIDDFVASLKFNEDGLIVAVAQDEITKKVLMQAWMNKESVFKSLESGRATYFSRSRNALWIKGETSGNIQQLIRIESDCDGDSLLLTVKQVGSACHTGADTCFEAGNTIVSER